MRSRYSNRTIENVAVALSEEDAMTNRSVQRVFIATLAAITLLPLPAYARYTISCSSNNYRYQYCGANTDGYARLLNQQSRAACIRGRTWGFDNGGVWVNNGCSAQFEVGGSSRSGVGNAGAAVAAGVGLAILGSRNRSGSVERGYYSGEMANLPSGAVGINPAGSGILVN